MLARYGSYILACAPAELPAVVQKGHSNLAEGSYFYFDSYSLSYLPGLLILTQDTIYIYISSFEDWSFLLLRVEAVRFHWIRRTQSRRSGFARFRVWYIFTLRSLCI